MKKTITLILLMFTGSNLFAQAANADRDVWTNPGVLITITLIIVPLLIVVYLITAQVSQMVKRIRGSKVSREAKLLAKSLQELSPEEIGDQLKKRKEALGFELSNTELGGENPPEDKKGLLHNIAEVDTPRFLAQKKKAVKRPEIDPALSKLILWYICTAAF